MRNEYVPPNPELIKAFGDVKRVLESFVPGVPEADRLTVKVQGILRAQLPHRERLRQITMMLYDGLAYGNWPWIDHSEVK